MIYAFHRINKSAAYLQLPYLLWVSFASVLNGAIWWLN
jgi:tryptophan-rich sensory protein